MADPAGKSCEPTRLRPREASLTRVDHERPLVKSVPLRWGRILTMFPYKARHPRAEDLVEDWAGMLQSTCPSDREAETVNADTGAEGEGQGI